MMPVVLPDLKAGCTKPLVSAWLMQPGDNVIEGDRLVEILLPGVTIDIPAPTTGRLTTIETPEQTPVTTGEIFGWITPEESNS